MAKKQWCVIDDAEDGIHVVPDQDLMGHVTTKRCACKPRVDEKGVIIHNSFDGREEYEPAQLFG